MTSELTDRELDNLATEEEFLANYDLSKYPPKGLTADLLIFTIREERLNLLLVKRGGHPEKGKWALPGGFVDQDETVDEAADRELKEETGLSVTKGYLEQLKTYSGPTRDPRGYITSVAYVALIPEVAEPEAGDDAVEAQFHPVDEVLESLDLAFDHKVIILDGLERVRAKLEYSPIAAHFIPREEFTIPDLMRIYEIVWGVKLKHPSNFRRKVKSTPHLLETVGKRGRPLFEEGRATDLYRLGIADEIFPPLRREEVNL